MDTQSFILQLLVFQAYRYSTVNGERLKETDAVSFFCYFVYVLICGFFACFKAMLSGFGIT